MYIAELVITNFRGIKHLSWKPSPGLNCLLGPGDATKSTILAAIDIVLSPSWSVNIDETDCFDLTTTNPITITATIVGPPSEWQSEGTFGLLLRGWSATSELHDEPEAGDKPALTLRFTVGEDAEPSWVVIADHHPNGKGISAKQRALCNTTRVDTVDRQLTWSTGTLLAKATSNAEQASMTFAKAAKAAREAFRTEDHPELTATATKLQTTALQYGVRPRGAFTAALDSKAMHLRAGCLTLHDAVVPARLFGLGTRRILTIALQELVTDTPAIALIDEFEHGLEPHRIRRLLRKLTALKDIQTFMTTHSPVVIHELAPTALHIVRSQDHATSVQAVPEEHLRKTIRAAPESLLARRLLVCEGDTEVGMIRSLDDLWASTSEPLASMGAIPLDGEGSTAPRRARDLKSLGYDVMIFGDSDGNIANEAPALRKEGIPVSIWDGAVSTEERLMCDLPWEAVKALLAIVLEDRDEQTVRNQVQSRVPSGVTLDLTTPVLDWNDMTTLRDILGKTAKSASWFKQLHLGEAVGKVVAQHLTEIPAKNTSIVLETLRVWLHRD